MSEAWRQFCLPTVLAYVFYSCDSRRGSRRYGAGWSDLWLNPCISTQNKQIILKRIIHLSYSVSLCVYALLLPLWQPAGDHWGNWDSFKGPVICVSPKMRVHLLLADRLVATPPVRCSFSVKRGLRYDDSSSFWKKLIVRGCSTRVQDER